MENYYKVLGVDKNASTLVIKKAFRLLAKEYHPDKNSNSDANEIFIKINLAYENLKDEVSRKKYDEEYFQFVKKKENSGFNSNKNDNYYNNEWVNRQEEFIKRAEMYSRMNYKEFESLLESLTYVGKKVKRGMQVVWGFILLIVFGSFSLAILINIFNARSLWVFFLLIICLIIAYGGWLKMTEKPEKY